MHGAQFLLMGLLILLCSCLSSTWVAMGFYNNPAYPGKCYIDADHILEAGESMKDPKICADITCGGGTKGVAHITGCPAYAAPRECELGDNIDNHSEYPICCLREVICQNPHRLEAALEEQKLMRQTFEQSYRAKLKERSLQADSNAI